MTAARSGAGRDHGVTLVEFVVAAVLTSLVAAATVGVFAGALRSMRHASVRNATAADVRVAMEQVTRELRVATVPSGAAAALVSATPTALSFYSAIDRTGTDVHPYRIDYTYDGTCLKVTQTPSLDKTATPDTANARTTCLLRTTTAPSFTYYPSGAISVNGITTPALDASAGLSAANLAAVRSVEITLSGQSADAADITGTPLRSRVTLTNVAAGAGG